MAASGLETESCVVWLLALAMSCLAVLVGVGGLIWPRFFGRQTVVWLKSTASVLIGSVVVVWLAGSFDQTNDDEITRQLVNKNGLTDTSYEQYMRKLAEEQLYTDFGTPVPVCTYTGDAEVTERYRRMGVALEAKFASALIRVAPQDPAYSCHGWTFTGGRYHILGDSVDRILRENRYQLVEKPQVGDVIVYRDAAGKILHSGIVRTADEQGLVLIESKWSILGRYLHAPDVQVYSQNFSYYRSPRRGHFLASQPKAIPSLPAVAAETVD